MNVVISGDYAGKSIDFYKSGKKLGIYIGYGKYVPLDKIAVQRYNLMGRNTRDSFNLGKAALGEAVLGFGGGIMGFDSKDVYRVAIYFRDGRKSLLEIDEKRYDFLTAILFGVEDEPAPQPSPAKPAGKKHLLLKIAIFLGSIAICLLIALFSIPPVDGRIELNAFWVLFVLGVPVVLAVVFPIKKKK